MLNAHDFQQEHSLRNLKLHSGWQAQLAVCSSQTACVDKSIILFVACRETTACNFLYQKVSGVRKQNMEKSRNYWCNNW